MFSNIWIQIFEMTWKFLNLLNSFFNCFTIYPFNEVFLSLYLQKVIKLNLNINKIEYFQFHKFFLYVFYLRIHSQKRAIRFCSFCFFMSLQKINFWTIFYFYFSILSKLLSIFSSLIKLNFNRKAVYATQ